MRFSVARVSVLALVAGYSCLATEREVLVPTNTTVRVMAANLNGNSQTIEPFEIRIFQGLRPDIVAIQEFRYSNSTPADIRSFINTAFGTNYTYYRETDSAYSIPNGVISRFPIRTAGSWDDPDIPDRGFAWAQIDLPGDVDLYVVSMHLKSSSGYASTRAHEAATIKNLVASNFPANAWFVIAGDSNIQDRNEAALATFKTFASDDPIPVDDNGNPNTNEPRSKPYDLVLPSPAFRTNFVMPVIGSRSFSNGLVFDSRVFADLPAVAPVQLADSGNGQHMAVLKDFSIRYVLTNHITVPEPGLALSLTNGLEWRSAQGVTYTVEDTSDLISWSTAAQVTATSGTVQLTNVLGTNVARFFRLSF